MSQSCLPRTESPIGTLCIIGYQGRVTNILLPGWHPRGESHRRGEPPRARESRACPPQIRKLRERHFTPNRLDETTLENAVRQLDAYFSGKLRSFTLEIEPQGSPFQLQVWEAILRIPYGETRSYKEIATEIGSPKATRAVGQAAGANPIPILIPCHRVVGSKGDLGGYSGGRGVKERLLMLEGSLLKTLG